MTWQPKPLAELPTVLAGPILRKVTNKEVSVWLALKSGEPITLDIYADNSTNQLVQSKTDAPVRLGDNLYVICITAKSSSPFLQDGMLYGYNITNSIGEGFSTSGFLDGGKDSITFSHNPSFGSMGKLPTFLIPATDIDDLRIIHGSCRKPHGQGIDSFEAIHDSYDVATQEEDVYLRPQMLCLTGDQIYSDDVADQLLYMIQSYIVPLFNWTEYLPISLGASLDPGMRSPIVLDVMKFPANSTDCKSHLLKFQEFTLMYIMVWSRALWSNNIANLLPTFDQVLSNVQESFSLEVDDFSPLPLNYTPVTPSQTKLAAAFYAEQENLKSFWRTLSKATRALANIPTYMIFDDHEISDDWFINYKWTKNALEPDSLQRRVIQNGMAAYSICQAWGNTPEQFETGQPGRTLVNYFQTIALNHNNSSYSSLWESLIGNIVLPDADTEDGYLILRRRSGGLKYHWVYVGVDFEVIALDCRSRRAFKISSPPDENGTAFLISTEGITEQIKSITSPKKGITFLISGTPIYGNGAIEALIEAARITSTTADTDFESWNINEVCRHTLLSALCSRASDASIEGWLKHPVVILSGDVHYGFTNQIQYMVKNSFRYNYNNIFLELIQCCASSMKNQTVPSPKDLKSYIASTTSWHRHDSHAKEYFKLDNYQHWGWNNENENQVVEVTLSPGLFQIDEDRRFLTNKPAIIKTNDYIVKAIDDAIDLAIHLQFDYIQPIAPWDWRVRLIAEKAVFGEQNNWEWTTEVTESEYHAMSSNHQMNFLKGNDAGRFIIGYNQFGDISLRWNQDGSNIKMLDHRIWWRNFGVNGEPLQTAFPLSTFVVTFI